MNGPLNIAANSAIDGLEITQSGSGEALSITGGNALFGDNDKAIFGIGNDLQIYHDGSASRIVDAGTGIMTIQASSQLGIYNADGTQVSAEFVNDGKVGLRFNGSEKLATTSTGIDVTGSVTADGLTVVAADAALAASIGSNEQRVYITPNGTEISYNASGDAAGSHMFQTGNIDRLNIASNGDLSLYEDTGTTPKFFWDSSAESLGIGTSSVATKLHVMGNSTVRNSLVSTLTLDAGISASNPYTNFGTGIDFKGRDYSNAIRNYGGIYSIMVGNTSPTTPAGDAGFNSALTFYTNTGGASGTNPTEKMRIDASGTLLVGRTGSSGLGKLNVEGGADFTGGDVYLCRDSGSVGIGCTPTTALDVSGAVTVTRSDVADDHSTISNEGGQFIISAATGGGGGTYPMLFKTAATERMRINSDGSVDVGAVANQTSAVLNARFNGAAIEFGHGNNGAGYYGTAGSYGNNGQPYIGFSCYSQENLNLFTTTGAKGNIITGDLSGNLTFAQVTTATAVDQSPENRMTLDASGNLLVGKTAASFTVLGAELRNSGQINSASTLDFLNMYSTSASAYRFYVTNAGQINATSTSISAISDQRFKENIRDLDDGLSKVMQLKPRKFDWKEGKGADTKDARGFIAQEFEEVFPDLIAEWKDPAPEGEEPYKSVSQDLIPTLVKAIQEQQAIIEALTARIAALES